MQIGISPKVKVPSSILFFLGILLTAYGSFSHDGGTISTIGLSLIGGSGISFGAGYKASPGLVKIVEDVASDDALSAEAKRGLDQAGDAAPR